MAIKASELRIGNIVFFSDTLMEPHKIKAGRLIDLYCDSFNSIPLTEDWLLKFGFEKRKNSYEYGLFVLYQEDSGRFGFTEFAVIVYINHVHKLQNLYFALTGQELEVKEPIKT